MPAEQTVERPLSSLLSQKGETFDLLKMCTTGKTLNGKEVPTVNTIQPFMFTIDKRDIFSSGL